MPGKTIGIVEVEGPRSTTSTGKAASPVYRADYAPNGCAPLQGASTCYELFATSALQYPSRPCLGFRKQDPEDPNKALPFEFLTYHEVSQIVLEIHAALDQMGVKPHDCIGVIGPNCPEWLLMIETMNRMSAVCVPLYETLGDNVIEYIVQHAGTKLIVSMGSKLKAIGTALSRGSKEVVTSGVVYWGKADPKDVQSIKLLGVHVYSWDEMIQRGRKAPIPKPVPPSPNDLCTIMYTSGTTGPPKGVMITHGALIYTISGVKSFLMHHGEEANTNDVFLSYLPLAHIFDRVVEEYMLHAGASIGYWQGDVKKLLDDVAALRPTVFVGVPRVFERICMGINEMVGKSSKLKQNIFKYAYQRKHYYLDRGFQVDQSTPAVQASYDELKAKSKNPKVKSGQRPPQGFRQHHASPISDKLVFNKIKGKLGGRVRVIISGGAPLPEQAEEFLRVAMCAPVVQGYGLTETCAASFISNPFDNRHMGTVGAPLAHTDLRLEAVPEMGYDPNPPKDGIPRGEILIRGPGLFKGYYKNPEMTREVLDKDGFFHTGDVGEILPCGTLKIIDRIKNIFKLAHGEYIAVERVENAYKMCGIVEQLWVYGSSFENFLVAVVIPKEEQLQQALLEVGVADAKSMKLEQLIKHPQARSAVLGKLQETGKAAKLKGFEIIKNIHLDSEQFTVQNDLMTPSFKLKRAPLQKKYQAVIQEMYAELKSKPQ